ncbi:MAG: ABC transporter substrate-binding protein [Methanospirillum sp.]|nr:ABC transporter substrate-binding protein [Methanospirillum sp.]
MTKERRKTLVLGGVILVVALVVFMAGCTQNTAQSSENTPTGVSSAPETTPSQSSSAAGSAQTGKYVIRANVDKDCTATPWLVGDKKGFFRHYDIDFRDAGSLDWSLMPAALVSGQTDVYDAEINALINLRQGGAKVVGVVRSNAEPEPSDTVHSHHMKWLVLNSSPYTPDSIKDLIADGHKPKIAVGAMGICADLETKAWFRQRNLTKDNVEFIVMPDPSMEAALRQGQIDVAVLHPAFYVAAEQHGGLRTLTTSYDAFGSHGGYSLLVFTEDFVRKNPDGVRAFIKAFKGGERWSNDHPVESGDILKDSIGVTIAASHYYSDTGEIRNEDIQPWIDEMIANGDLKPGEVNASDLYTKEFSDLWVDEPPYPLDPYPEGQ